jgi:TPR repeat protein
LASQGGDVDEAIFWLQKAADQGIAEAKSNLALAYRQRVPSANSFPSAGRNSSDELVDQMRADQRQRDRENADAERREWEETNRRQMEDIQRGQELYNQRHQ